MTSSTDLLESAIATLRSVLDDVVTHEESADAATPCTTWDVADLCGHLEAIAGSYVMWASAAGGGRDVTLRSGETLARWNEEMVQRLPHRDLATRIERWADLAGDHHRLVAAFGDADGIVLADGTKLTITEHAGIAAVEWWLHAWDLATALGVAEPTPSLVPDLISVWRTHLARVTGEPATGPLEAATLLRASGRGVHA